MFKAMMLDTNNQDYLKEFIHMITNIPIKDLRNITIENAEYIIDNKNDKGMRSGIIVSVGKKYLNIELNKDYYKVVFSKNDAYAHKIATTMYNKGEDYLESGCIIQINFDNFTIYKSKKEIYKFLMLEETSHEEMDDQYINYHIDLGYIYKKCYNKPIENLSKFQRYCLMLMAETKKFADKISGDDKIMSKVSDRLEILSSDNKMIGLYDAEIEEEKVRKTQLRGAKEEGIEEGSNQKAIEIAKNMLIKNIDINLISEITDLSIETLNNLKNETN